MVPGGLPAGPAPGPGGSPWAPESWSTVERPPGGAVRRRPRREASPTRSACRACSSDRPRARARRPPRRRRGAGRSRHERRVQPESLPSPRLAPSAPSARRRRPRGGPVRPATGAAPLGPAWAGHLRGAPNGCDAPPTPRGKRRFATVRDRWFVLGGRQSSELVEQPECMVAHSRPSVSEPSTWVLESLRRGSRQSRIERRDRPVRIAIGRKPCLDACSLRPAR